MKIQSKITAGPGGGSCTTCDLGPLPSVPTTLPAPMLVLRGIVIGS